ncbi:MAG: hypothetical protein GY780_04830 [bacterium]|nr:hypothetical protein [bacterium]
MSEFQETTAPKTPWHLWAVGTVAFLWSAMGCFDFIMTQTKNEAYMSKFTPELLDYFYNYPEWLVALWAVGVFGGALGGILLLLRRKWSLGFLAASLAGALISTIKNYVFSNSMEITGTFGLVMTLLILVLGIAFLFYAQAMNRQGILK